VCFLSIGFKLLDFTYKKKRLIIEKYPYDAAPPTRKRENYPLLNYHQIHTYPQGSNASAEMRNLARHLCRNAIRVRLHALPHGTARIRLQVSLITLAAFLIYEAIILMRFNLPECQTNPFFSQRKIK
jgi:hypothetical protein